MVSKNEKLKEKPLTSSEIQRFRKLLLSKRAEILGDVDHMEASTLSRDGSDFSHSPSHMADVSSDNYETENLLGLMDSERKLLFEVEEALQRIDENTFGLCQGNGELIPRARLIAIPWAKYCVACASQKERFSKSSDTPRKKYYFAPGHDDVDDDDTSVRNVMNYEKD